MSRVQFATASFNAYCCSATWHLEDMCVENAIISQSSSANSSILSTLGNMLLLSINPIYFMIFIFDVFLVQKLFSDFN